MSSDYPPTQLERTFEVRSYEVDPDGKLSVVSLVQMLQEVAWLHASALGKGYADRSEDTRYWVLARLRIRMERYPAWGDVFTITTYPVGTDRLLALREFRIDDEAGALLGRVATGWLIVDGASGRPIRPQQLVQDLEVHDPAFAADMGKVPELDETAVTLGPVPVRYAEIDQYHHVNNAAYVSWVADAVAAQFGETAASGLPAITGLAVDYLQETLISDRRSCRLSHDTVGGRYLVEVSRERDTTITCRASVELGTDGHR